MDQTYLDVYTLFMTMIYTSVSKTVYGARVTYYYVRCSSGLVRKCAALTLGVQAGYVVTLWSFFFFKSYLNQVGCFYYQKHATV